VRRSLGLACPTSAEVYLEGALAQRRSAETGAGWLVLVDLPVDAIVVLEQQERAGEPERGERALCECECPQ
jgi:hypothetical protein